MSRDSDASAISRSHAEVVDERGAGALQIQAAEPATIAIASLTRDPELICRAAGIKKATVAEYAESMGVGASFPAVVVFGPDSKGSFWLADGFHRCAAAERAGLLEVAADIRQGGRKDALLFAASANAGHGLRRTNADKRKAVSLVLAACPRWSDRKIAEAVGVDNKTVGAARKAAAPANGEIPQGEAQAGEAAEPSASDATVERLSKALQRLLAQWPAERRPDVQTLVVAALGGAT